LRGSWERRGRDRPLDRGEEPRAVGREVLRRARIPEAAREDDGREVVRTELVHRGLRDAPRQLLIGHPHRPVEHDDDEPAFGADVVGDGIGRRLAHPRRHRRRRLALGEIDGEERDDWPRLAVLEHREIRGGQATNRLAILVEDGHVHLDNVQAGLKSGPRLLILAGERTRLAGEANRDTHDGSSHSRSPSPCDLTLPAAVSGQRSAVSGERSAVSGQR
jgi:hypothetical protein